MYSLEQLNDIEEIRQLKARYFRLMDTKQWQQWRSIFADDIELNVDLTVPDAEGNILKRPTVHGLDNVIADVSTTLAYFRTVHHGHMSEITLQSATSANGIWAMEDIVESDNGKLQGYGHYHETYTKIDGQWRIKSLHLTRLRLDVSGEFAQ